MKFICVNCNKEVEIEAEALTDILLCEECTDDFDLETLWMLHDRNEVNALDFNESEEVRDRFRVR